MTTESGSHRRQRKTIPVTRPGVHLAATVIPTGDETATPGVVSDTIRGMPQPPGTAPSTLDRTSMERLIGEAVRFYDKAVRDFRRVEGIATPTRDGLGYSALQLVFHKWIEMAALSLERAASALDDALFGLLRHLYCETAGGRQSQLDAAALRRTLEGLDLLRQEISVQQKRLRQLAS